MAEGSDEESEKQEEQEEMPVLVVEMGVKSEYSSVSGKNSNGYNYG